MPTHRLAFFFSFDSDRITWTASRIFIIRLAFCPTLHIQKRNSIAISYEVGSDGLLFGAQTLGEDSGKFALLEYVTLRSVYNEDRPCLLACIFGTKFLSRVDRVN